LPLGQRIEEFAIDEWRDGTWRQFTSGTSIGNCRLTRSERITTTKIRVRITKAAAAPALSELGVFVEPE
jgi:alpha-L-fucosidase